MRPLLWLTVALAAYGQAPRSSEQQPAYQPGWPCTGKERAFDPVYSQSAEHSGGHLFLFDKAEVIGASALALGDMKHPDTILRASGKVESYVDIPVPVDASVDSLLVVASLQCMQIIQLYDPQRSVIIPAADQDHWYRAGRIATIPQPMAGEWIVRLAGTGAYSVAVQAHAALGMHAVEVHAGQPMTVSLRLSAGSGTPRFELIGPAGETIQPLPLEADLDSPGLFRGAIAPAPPQFRIRVNGESGFQRVDPRLFEGAPPR